MPLAATAQIATKTLDQMAGSLAKIGAAADASLTDAIKRGQTPELIEALKKALRI